jgi:hypothetical protein
MGGNGFRPTAQNIEVSLQAGELVKESVIVGAHFDTGPHQSGADSATGIASLLALSRLLVDKRFRRSVRFVAYSLGEAPHIGAESLGSLRHARKVAADGDTVRAMIGLDSLGRFSDQAGTQKPLAGIDLALPTVGSFLLVLGTKNSQSVSMALADACTNVVGVEIVVRNHSKKAEPELASDDRPYRRLGIPTVLVSDTKAYRTRPVDDAPRHLDFPRMTRFVSCLGRAVAELANAGDPA